MALTPQDSSSPCYAPRTLTRSDAQTPLKREAPVKRVAFGITNLRNYRIRALLYAGKPNWELLDTLTPR